MEAIREMEVFVNIFLQSLGPLLRSIMRVFTLFGDEIFYIIFMPAIYWCVNAYAGLRIGIMLLISTSFNNFFKLLLKGPRPYWISRQVKPVVHESSFGIPSGHAMNSASVWGWSAIEARKRWVSITCITLIFMIGFSRLVMGVHFLSDVLLGWLLGALIVLVFSLLLPTLSRWVRKWTLSIQLLAAFASSLIMIAISATIKVLSVSWSMPPEWAARAGEAEPLSLNGAITAGGIWFGMLGGFALLRKTHGILRSQEGTWQKIARYALGLAVVFLLYTGLGQLFPRNMGFLSDFLRYLRYFLIGFWISFLSPLVFEKLNIATIDRISE